MKSYNCWTRNKKNFNKKDQFKPTSEDIEKETADFHKRGGTVKLIIPNAENFEAFVNGKPFSTNQEEFFMSGICYAPGTVGKKRGAI